MEKEELEKLYKDFTLQLVLSKNLDDIGLIAITKKHLKQIIKIIKHYNQIQSQLKKQKEVIDKAIETLEKGITFCENDSQGIYDKCNIAINREKKILNILKEVSE